jgi:tetratricopeptide (TPR) repeat protein
MPPTPERTPYDVLGVPRAASVDDIKKRYRELARKHHPDVNRNDPSAAQRFAEISQAYRTLSDADSRRTLDAELSLREQRAQQAAARQQSASTGGTSAYNARRPASGQPPPGSGARPNTAAGAAAASAASESLRLSNEGRTAYNRDRPVEARNLAEQALRLNRRNAEAWELLGDVFRRQSRVDESLNAYTMAMQLDPRNGRLRDKFERMARAAGPTAQETFYDNSAVPGGGRSGYGASPSPRSGYAGYGGASRPASASPGRVSRLSEEKRPLGRLLAGTFGYGMAFLTILWTALNPGDAPRTAMLQVVSGWNANITVALALVGALLGATMTISGAIRRIDDELILSGVSQRGGAYLPLGLLVIVLSVLNFYLAAVVYAVVTFIQESFTPSMVRVFGAVMIAVGLLAMAYPHNHFQVLLFGGNVVFIAFVVGWLLGDFFRADVL